MLKNLSTFPTFNTSSPTWFDNNFALLKLVNYWMVLLCFGGILILGVFGNLYAWAVLVYDSRYESSKNSSISSAFASCWSCSNTNPSTFLIEVILLLDAFTVGAGAANHFGSAFGFTLRNWCTIACISHYFVDHFARDWALWNEGLFSVMRLVAVTWPHKIRVPFIHISHLIILFSIKTFSYHYLQLIFTLNRVKLFILLMGLILLAKNAPQAGLQQVIPTSSGPTCYYPVAVFSLVFTVIEFGVEVLVPYPVYFVCSTIVAYQVSKALQQHHHLVHSIERSASGRRKGEFEKISTKEENSSGAVRLLLINNVSFVLLYSPYNVYRVFQVRHYFLNSKL